MVRVRPRGLALVGLALGLLTVPAAARATVTIGSNLQRTTMASTGCFPNCTAVLSGLSADAQAPGGVASPVNGTITTWRLGVGNKSGPTALRVVRALPNGTYTGAGTSAVVIPALESNDVFAISLPIQRGDLIGLDCCAAPGATYFTANHPGGRVFFEPGFLGDGAPGATPSGTDTFEILLNADIEPSSAFTIDRARAKKGGAITVTVDLPNPGTIVAGDRTDPALTRAAHSRKRPLLLKPDSVEAAAGSVSLTVAITKAARRLLAASGHLKVPVKLTFTPTNGKPASQTVGVKLRR